MIDDWFFAVWKDKKKAENSFFESKKIKEKKKKKLASWNGEKGESSSSFQKEKNEMKCAK